MDIKKFALDDNYLDQVSGGTILPYIAQTGDSLKDIAERYKVSKELLAKWNGIASTDIDKPGVIKPGDLLKIKY